MAKLKKKLVFFTIIYSDCFPKGLWLQTFFSQCVTYNRRDNEVPRVCLDSSSPFQPLRVSMNSFTCFFLPSLKLRATGRLMRTVAGTIVNPLFTSAFNARARYIRRETSEVTFVQRTWHSASEIRLLNCHVRLRVGSLIVYKMRPGKCPAPAERGVIPLISFSFFFSFSETCFMHSRHILLFL